jgi:DNA polymerase-3 subunit chi
MCEFWFYHLERSTLEQVLPGLLEKTRERGWKALVRVSDPAQLEALDEHLWTWRDDSFLAHGRASEPNAARQPVLLSESGENLNAAQALFMVDGAEIGVTDGLERCFIIFDGQNDQALTGSRERWKALKARGETLAYWKQSPEGRWEKAA